MTAEDERKKKIAEYRRVVCAIEQLHYTLQRLPTIEETTHWLSEHRTSIDPARITEAHDAVQRTLQERKRGLINAFQFTRGYGQIVDEIILNGANRIHQKQKPFPETLKKLFGIQNQPMSTPSPPSKKESDLLSTIENRIAAYRQNPDIETALITSGVSIILLGLSDRPTSNKKALQFRARANQDPTERTRAEKAVLEWRKLMETKKQRFLRPFSMQLTKRILSRKRTPPQKKPPHRPKTH